MLTKEEYIKSKIRQYHQKKNKEECIKKNIQKYHLKKNKENAVKKKIHQYKQNNNNRVCIENNTEKYYKKKTKIKKEVDIYRNLAREDIIYQILNNLASRINNELKKRNIDRPLTYMKFLGCTAEDFKSYLEDKFIEGMDYNNYGEWEVDHKFPISKINFSDIEDIKKCFHYTNLQPLWWLDNKQKSNKI